ncbi:MAG TPA: hypothetical protein VLS89_03030 [Candidatus Nanopelagicales bacterium]|nr:hypothetical protein [Candidatus Nanopelagicales bacterium]
MQLRLLRSLGLSLGGSIMSLLVRRGLARIVRALRGGKEDDKD